MSANWAQARIFYLILIKVRAGPGSPEVIPSSPPVPVTPITLSATRPALFSSLPALLIITANNASMVLGMAVPPLSLSYHGFVNGDSPGNLATQPTVTTQATPVSSAGAYPIVAGGASSPDYAINYASGVLVITPAPMRVLGVSIQSIRLGKTKKTTQVIVIQFSGSLNAGDAQNAGDYSVATISSNKKQKSKAVALSQANYNPANNTVRLVTRKPLVLNPSLKVTFNAAALLNAPAAPLDGNHDGQSGGNCVFTLSKQVHDHRLANSGRDNESSRLQLQDRRGRHKEPRPGCDPLPSLFPRCEACASHRFPVAAHQGLIDRPCDRPG